VTLLVFHHNITDYSCYWNKHICRAVPSGSDTRVRWLKYLTLGKIEFIACLVNMKIIRTPTSASSYWYKASHGILLGFTVCSEGSICKLILKLFIELINWDLVNLGECCYDLREKIQPLMMVRLKFRCIV
jgi:hypothetical protein